MADNTGDRMVDVRFVDTYGSSLHFGLPLRELNKESSKAMEADHVSLLKGDASVRDYFNVMGSMIFTELSDSSLSGFDLRVGNTRKPLFLDGKSACEQHGNKSGYLKLVTDCAGD